MTGERYIKQALIAALCEHPEHEKYKARAFSGENLEKVVQALSEQRNKLTKQDLFTPDDEGRYIINTPGFWKNFDKIFALVEKAGDKFTADDFSRPLGTTPDAPTLIDGARMASGLGKIFSFDVWQGRFDEMERLWYKVPVPSRRDLHKNDGLLDLGLKRRLLAAEGRDMPEDRLLKSGLTAYDVRQAFAERGNFEELNRKLAQNGDWLRKEYLLLRDSSGDTVFDQQGAWDRYPEVSRILSAHGEKMETADFIRQVGNANNVLNRAAEKKALHRVFAPELWVNRLPEMLDLWSYVRDGWKPASLPSKEFDVAYAAAESGTYASRIDFTRFESKAELLRPLNADAVSAGAEKQILPLGLKTFWENFETVQQKLSNMNERLTLSDLRQQSGQMGNTCLMGAVKFGHFADVLDIARRSGEIVTLDDFLSKDRHGVTMLSLLAERNELGLVFAPELWAGRVGDMRTLWSHLRIGDRNQVDIQQAEVAAKQATLRQQAKNKFKLKPGGPT